MANHIFICYRKGVRNAMVKVKKKQMEISLGLFFLKYFGYLFVGILGIAVLVIFAFMILWTSESVYPARYAEQQALLAAPVIEHAEKVSADMIPELCRYAVFDDAGRLQDGSLEGRSAERAWEAVEGKTVNMGGFIGGYYYKVIRWSKGYCVLRYQIMSQYRSAFLRQYFPPPEVLILVLMLLAVLIVILLTAVRFSRVMREKLFPLLAVSDRIQKQELDFTVTTGSIREINVILHSMDNMRMALKQSLEKQWSMEQRKQEQISALAHDLKTPLTLIRGNAELLCDTSLTREQQECTDCVLENALQMQHYVQMLIEMTKTAQAVPICRRKTDLELCLLEVKRQAERLCAIHGLALTWECRIAQQEIYADPNLLVRALLNLLDNAAEHTPRGGRVSVEMQEDEKDVIFIVCDTGPGFSERALRHGKEQFYMDDDSRTASRAHYGMGLYIVDMIMRQHSGTLALGNSPDEHGACVTIRFPKE